MDGQTQSIYGPVPRHCVATLLIRVSRVFQLSEVRRTIRNVTLVFGSCEPALWIAGDPWRRSQNEMSGETADTIEGPAAVKRLRPQNRA